MICKSSPPPPSPLPLKREERQTKDWPVVFWTGEPTKSSLTCYHSLWIWNGWTLVSRGEKHVFFLRARLYRANNKIVWRGEQCCVLSLGDRKEVDASDVPKKKKGIFFLWSGWGGGQGRGSGRLYFWSYRHHRQHHHQSRNREARLGTIDDFTTTFLHFFSVIHCLMRLGEL